MGIGAKGVKNIALVSSKFAFLVIFSYVQDNTRVQDHSK